MKKILKMIIILMICLIILMVALIIVIQKNASNNQYISFLKGNVENDIEDQNIPSVNENLIEGEQITYDTTQEVKSVIPEENYTILYIVNTYYSTINKAYYNNQDSEGKEKIIDKLYNMLSRDYINSKNIEKTENIFNYVDNINEQILVEPLQIKALKNYKKRSYAVYGYIMNLDYKYIRDICIVVDLDFENRTFEIYPIIQGNKSIDNVTLQNDNQNIDVNNDNTFKLIVPTQEYIANYYLSYYKKMALSRPDLAYERLNAEYKEKRFVSLEDYKKYVEKNRDILKKVYCAEYSISIRNGYVEYVCKDEFGDYYFFDEKETLDIEIFLDTYTIEYSEFTKKYKSSEDENKAALNIEKIKAAINNQDYNYIYDKAYREFKNKYYPTKENLKQFMENNLFVKNNFEYTNIEKQDSSYIFDVTVTDATRVSTEEKYMTFVVKLYTETDFVFSFSMSENHENID